MKPTLKPVLVVAPHLCFPARNGSDIYQERVARHLSSHAEYVDLVACQVVRRYRNLEIETETHFDNQMRSKTAAALRTLFFRSHYYAERFNTAAVVAAVRNQTGSTDYATIIASYLTTLATLPAPGQGQSRLVCTHNDEFKWFEDIIRTAGNPLTRQVASFSLKWLKRKVPALVKSAVMVHVSTADWQGFDQVAPGHRHLVVSLGTDIDSLPQWPTDGGSEKIKLTFMATLGVKMATDALQHFRESFEPKLRAAFGANLEIRVVGSKPAPSVIELCRLAGWQLFPDVAEPDFVRLLHESTFTLLPFPYSTGIKLKLIRSLGGGIPFLSTTASRPPHFPVLPGCCFSDDVADWVAAIKTWQESRGHAEARREMLAVAQAYSWPAVVAKLAENIIKIKESASPAT